MDGATVLITGASAGIGESCAWKFAALNSKLILVGRRRNALENVRNEIMKEYPNTRIHCHTLDVQDTAACMALPDQLPKGFNEVDVLVNNAGLALGVATAIDNDIAQGQQMLQTNSMGVIAMTRAFLPGMIARNRGHVINMGSIAGSMYYGTGSMYCASKAAVQAFTWAAQHDLRDSPVRMTLLSPGLIGNTEFSLVRYGGDSSKAANVYDNIVPLHPDDVADDVIYAVTRPAHVQIADIKVFATNQSGPKDVSRVGANLGAK
eukprot:GSChrysophyteH1.ASY1.ANO1.2391.1 assembled CDS